MEKSTRHSLLILLCMMTLFPFHMWGTKKTGNSTPDFDYPQTVSKTALADLNTALDLKDGSKTVDALVRYALAQGSISQENLPGMISRIDSVIAIEKTPDIRALLYHLEARIFESYKQAFAKPSRQNAGDDSIPKDYTEWDKTLFNNKIKELVAKSMRDTQALKASPLSKYKGLFIYDDLGLTYVPTLFEFFSKYEWNFEADKSSTDYQQAWCDYEKEQGNIPAYLYACINSRNKHNLKKLYEQYKYSEYSGMILERIDGRANYNTFKDYVARFPNTFYTPIIQNKIARLERKSTNIENKKNLRSDENLVVDVNATNIKHLTLNLYQVPDAVWKKVQHYWDRIKVADMQLLTSKKIEFAGQEPFDSKTKVDFGTLNYGRYVVLPSFINGNKVEGSKNVDWSDVILVSDLLTFYSTAKDNPSQIFAVDAKWGKPLAGITLKSEKNKLVTGKDGSAIIPKSIDRANFLAINGNDKYGPTLNYYSRESQLDIPVQSAKIFTDLGIYRPGETVKFAAIVYETTSLTRAVKAGSKVHVKFNDFNGKQVDTITLITDDYGRIEGSFKIPTDRLNGMWEIIIRNAGSGSGSQSFLGLTQVNVSEYKTPTFTVEFTGSRNSYTKGQPVKITGQVKTYSGTPVANAQVALLLTSHPWSWWWRWERNNGEVINDTTIVTDNEGNFTIEYPVSAFINDDEDDDVPYYEKWKSYSVTALVTNVAGETQEGSHSFITEKHRGLQFAGDDFTLVNETPVMLPIDFNSTDENEESVTCTYMVTTLDKKLVKSGTFVSDKPKVDFTQLPSGEYLIEVQVAGDTTTVANASMVLYKRNDKIAPVKDAALWIPQEGDHVDDNNVAHVLIGTSVPESHIYYIACSRNRLLSQGWLKYNPGMHDFKIQIPNEPDEQVHIKFFNVYNGKITEKSCSLTSTIYRQKLNVKVTAFRDRLVPGEKERWQFQLLDKDNKPVKGAMLLEMYDKALNNLVNNGWTFAPSYSYMGNPIDFSALSLTGSCFHNLSGEVHNNRTDSYLIPYLNLYKRDFFFHSQMYLRGVGSPVRAEVMCEVAKRDMASDSKLEKEVEPDYGDVEQALSGMVSGLGLTENATESMVNMDNLNQVKVRLSDVKTALWQPMLVSDGQGNISLEFEVPQYNTTWIMQAIGYTSNLVTDNVQKEVMTQKPLMVKTSLPRFVRQGDAATLTASVQNATDHDTQCDAIIELFDPRTGEIYTSRNFKEKLTGKGTNAVSIDWTVPDTIPFVGFRIKAANDNFGDGEQVMIPVLTAISPVIETKPFFIDATAQSFSMTMPEFKKDSRVTLEYCNNPVWYCVTALPTIFNNNYRIATTLVHNLYAEVLAQGIAKAQPQISEAIGYWKNNAQDSALVSMLAKNQDLKIGTLLASPWLRDADRQTLRMSKLDELFDEAKMKIEHEKIVKGLEDLQLSDGGWCWYRYPDCRSSLWTTGEVLEIVGELQHLGYLKDDARINAMMKKALVYYDAQYLKLFKEQLKYSKKNYSGFSEYVYVRTLFKNIAPSKANADMLAKCLKAMTKDWKGLSLNQKAYFAMALNRNNYKQVAKSIVESIRQFSIIKPELGMYWDNLQQGWYYFDKVAVTSTILQAMHEIDPRTSEIDQVRKWILLMKQSNDWGSSSLAADAIYSILSTGSQWLGASDSPSITIDGKEVELDRVSKFLGYCRMTIPATSLSTLKIERNGQNPAWGAVYSQYKAPMTSVKEYSITEMSIHKEYYTYAPDGSIKLATELKVGDKVQVRTIIKNNKDLDYVTVTDERGACFEPVKQLSGYQHADGSWFYMETKDALTNIFFDDLQKGTHVISYDVYVTAPGQYSAGIATAQCQYAPQISAHSAGRTLTVKAK